MSKEQINMKDFTPYPESLELKALGFDEPCFNRFYTKPQSKMFGVDEKGRHYPIKNTPKKLYIIGEDFVLNDSNVILAPTFSQCFRFFREKYGLEGVAQRSEDFIWYKWKISQYNEDGKKYVADWYEYETFEEAELACLIKLIEIVKEKKQ